MQKIISFAREIVIRGIILLFRELFPMFSDIAYIEFYK
jgi:hypothetical protein